MGQNLSNTPTLILKQFCIVHTQRQLKGKEAVDILIILNVILNYYAILI